MPPLEHFRSCGLGSVWGGWVAAGVLVGVTLVALGRLPEAPVQVAREAPPGEPARPPKELTSASAVDPGWLNDVQRAIAASEYKVSSSVAGPQAPNRAHSLRSYFEPTGVRVVERTPEAAPLVTLRLLRFGREDQLAEIGPGIVQYEGARAEIHRPGLIEWFENSPSGLEQGFQVAQPPAGSGALVLEIDVAEATGHAVDGSVRLRTPTGRQLEYGKLEVFDALGTRVPARLEVSRPERIRLVVADAGYRYPYSSTRCSRASWIPPSWPTRPKSTSGPVLRVPGT